MMVRIVASARARIIFAGVCGKEDLSVANGYRAKASGDVVGSGISSCA